MPVNHELNNDIVRICMLQNIIHLFLDNPEQHQFLLLTQQCLQIGARGYVTKNSSKEEMMKAILEVHQGNKYVCDEIKNNISELVLEENRDVPNVNALTEREIQIINLIKDGQSSKEIAVHLNISLKTVEVHRHNVLKKLKLKNSASLVNFINNTATYNA